MRRAFLLGTLVFLLAASGLLADFRMDTSLSDSDASFIGEAENDQAGICVSNVGDVNGDGYDDFAIGSYANSYAGQTYLFFGKASGWSIDTSLADADASFMGEAVGDCSGESLSRAGDVNGDGYDDLLIGAPNNDEGGNRAGQTYLILGKASGWAMDTSLGDSDASFIGEAAEDRAGSAISGAGDVNGDGFDDFIVGAPFNGEGGSGAGQAYLVFGKASGWAMDTSLSDSDASFWGEAAEDAAGSAVSGAGDVNGDGHGDFIIGSPNNDEAGDYAGQAYLILGKASGWAMDASLADSDASFLGEAADDSAGSTVSGPGDVNADGIDDLLIGTPYNGEGGFWAGQIYLILGKTSGWAMDTSLADSNASFIGEADGDFAGYSASGGGDVNGDGYRDLVIGAWNNNEAAHLAGQTYLILGKASGWAMDTSLADSDASFWGEATQDRAGYSVSGAGDVNADGYDDFIIGAHTNNEGGDHAGQVYLILGEHVGPRLSDPTHSPDYGRTDTDFTFTVHYYHAAGQAPSRIQVFVNDAPYDMALDSGTAADGVYAWTGKIPQQGLSQYHFEAEDAGFGSAVLWTKR